MRSPEAVAGMLCPICKVPLAMSDRQGIEIDYCPNCRGIWLDRGELDKIIERSAAPEAPPPAPPPPRAPQAPYPPQPPYPPQGGAWQTQAGYGHDPRHYPRKRRKSFLEELFDD